GYSERGAESDLGERRQGEVLPLRQDAGAGVRRAGLMLEPLLAGQTVVVIGGSSGIGHATARLAASEGAALVLPPPHPHPRGRVGPGLGARLAPVDATDFARLARFFAELPGPIDHVLVTGPGPYYAPLAEFDVDRARRDVEAHLLLPIQVARHAAPRVRPGG